MIRNPKNKQEGGEADSRAFILLREGQPVGYIAACLNDKEFPTGAKQHPEFAGYGHVCKIGILGGKENRSPEGALLLIGAAESWLQSVGVKGAWLDYLPYGREKPPLNTYSRLGYAYNRLGYVDADTFTDSRGRIRRIAVKKW